MAEKLRRVNTPGIHPNCAILQANDSTPDPTIVVIICALAVHTVPAQISAISSTNVQNFFDKL